MKKPVFTLLCSYEKLYEMQAPYSRVCAGPDPANIGPIRVMCGINFENIPICIRVDFILLSVHCAGYTEITHAPFSSLLRKEYFYCPQRDSHAVYYN